MLASLGGIPIVEWVMRRSLRIRGVDEMILATSQLPADDELVQIADRCSMKVFRGSHDDVLKRVLDAASLYEPDGILRICADNPFIDPDVVSELVASFRTNWCDYAFNHRPGLGLLTADGFGGEMFDVTTLRSIAVRFSEPRYREHLTSPFWEHQELFSIRAVPVDEVLRRPELRFDVDTESDLQYLISILNTGGISLESSAADVVKAADAN